MKHNLFLFAIAASLLLGACGPDTPIDRDINTNPAPDSEPDDNMGLGDAEFGDPCTTSRECASGYCVHGGEVIGFCTELCSGGCSRDGLECRTLQGPDESRISVCYPEETRLCQPCAGHDACGRGSGNRCLEMPDGPHCALQCEPGDFCPVGYECITQNLPGNDAAKVCTLVSDEAACTDCFGVDFLTDVNNCGFCGNECDILGGTEACVEGFCGVGECDEGLADCNEDPEDGCETELAENCNSCDPLLSEAGEACGTCESGVLECDGNGGLVCVGDLGLDANNVCGGCGTLPEVEIGGGCGTCLSGQFECDGANAIECVGDLGDTARNVCGGCLSLEGQHGQSCGACNDGAFVCDGPDALRCEGASEPENPNACGGCEALSNPPGISCGPCTNDVYICQGPNSTVCNFDSQRNLGDGRPLDNSIFDDEFTLTLSPEGGPFVISSDLIVPGGKTLIVEAGVIFKMEARPNRGETVDFIIDGQFESRGTAELPVVFTSSRNDCRGGDSNGDGTSTEAAPGDWGALVYRGSLLSQLQHLVVEFGGGGLFEASPLPGQVVILTDFPPSISHISATDGANRGIFIQNPSSTIIEVANLSATRNGANRANDPSGRGIEIISNGGPIFLDEVHVHDNATDGLRVATEDRILASNLLAHDNEGDGLILEAGGVLNLSDSESRHHQQSFNAVLTGNHGSRIQNNRFVTDPDARALNRGVVARVVPALVEALTLEDNNNTLEGTQRGIHVFGGDITSDTTWHTATYIIEDNVTVAEGATWTLAPSSTLKVQAVLAPNLRDIELLIEGHVVFDGEDGPILITSSFDDTAGGDTNADGGATQPEPGDWAGLKIAANASISANNLTLAYAGGNTNTGHVNGITAFHLLGFIDTIDGLTITDSLAEGIRIESSTIEAHSLLNTTVSNWGINLNGIQIQGGTAPLSFVGLNLTGPGANDGIRVVRTGQFNVDDANISGVTNGIHITDVGSGTLENIQFVGINAGVRYTTCPTLTHSNLTMSGNGVLSVGCD